MNKLFTTTALAVFAASFGCLTATASNDSLERNVGRLLGDDSPYSKEYVVSVMNKVYPRLARMMQDEEKPAVDYVHEFEVFIKQVLPLYAYQMANRVPPAPAEQTFDFSKIYQAPKDGCYFGIGDARNSYDPMGIDCEACENEGGKVKTSGSYAWGMTSYGDKLYWSTNNNYLCMPGYGVVATSGKETGPFENSCWVCEYGKGLKGKEKGVYGDIVAPRIYEYDTKTGVVTDITPDDALLESCQGLRSATVFNGIIFFGGPSIIGGSTTQSSSSVFLAYSPAKGEFIGSSDMSSVEGCQITNVRRWVEVDGVLYCGVGIIDQNKQAKGAVLRWKGSEEKPFDFEIVGWTPTEAAEIEFHKGRLYVGGWPTNNSSSAIYRSPEIPRGGFTSADASEWEQVWAFSDYEVNPGSQKFGYFSVMKSWNGRLYWGMFANTFGVVYGATAKYGSIESADAIAHVLGSLRSSTMWSTENFNSPDDIEMLYGESQLPAFSASDKAWTLQPNASGYEPKFGRSGFGNVFTSYTWSMAVYDNQLYVGTMDMSDLIDPAMGYMFDSMVPSEPNDSIDSGFGDIIPGLTGPSAAALTVLKALLQVDNSKLGYELIRFSNHDDAPEMISDNGFGNPAAYGIRNMAVNGHDLYIGTANPFNLHPSGGWEIIRFHNEGAGVETVDVEAAAIMFRRENGLLTFSTLDGSAIESVRLTDMNGRTVAIAKDCGNTVSIEASDCKGMALAATVQTADYCKTFKLMVR